MTQAIDQKHLHSIVSKLGIFDENSYSHASTGGWRILKSRGDKDANHSSVASKVWETINGYDLRDSLQETLN